MKKILFAAVGLLAAISYAQDITYGAKAGVNISNFSGNDIEDTKPVFGALFGGFAEISISDKFSIQPELLFSMQGARSEYSESEPGYSFSEENRTKLNYLNIPVLAKYFINEKIALLAGPQVGILLSAKEKFEGTETFMGQTISYAETIDAKDFYRSIVLGFNIGVTYSFTDKIFVDARYNLGLSSITKKFTDEFGDSFSANIKNNVLQFSIGYKF